MITEDDMKKFNKKFASKKSYQELKKELDWTNQDIANLAAMMIKGFDELNRKFDIMQNQLDAFVLKIDRDEQERVMIGNGLSRHETWITHIAAKTNITLPES
jgi:hypothetical protein